MARKFAAFLLGIAVCSVQAAPTTSQIKGQINGVTIGWNPAPIDSTLEQALVGEGITVRRLIEHNNQATCNADGTGFTKGANLDTAYNAALALTGTTKIVDTFTHLPAALRTATTGAHYTYSGSAALKTYIKGYLDYVYGTLGANNVYLEFGNEWLATDDPWVDLIEATTKDTNNGDTRYDNYLAAYIIFATAVAEWRVSNPTKTVYVGGPSANYAFASWQTPGQRLDNFVTDVQAAGKPLDFVSVHLYGLQPPNTTSKTYYEFVSEMVTAVRNVDSDMPIIATEIGAASTAGNSNVYGHAGLQMADYLERAYILALYGITESYFLLPYDGSGADISTKDYYYYYDKANGDAETSSFKANALLQDVSGTYQSGATFTAWGGNADPFGLIFDNNGTLEGFIWNFAHKHRTGDEIATYQKTAGVKVTISGIKYRVKRYKLNGSTTWVNGEPFLPYESTIWAELERDVPDGYNFTTKKYR